MKELVKDSPTFKVQMRVLYKTDGFQAKDDSVYF